MTNLLVPGVLSMTVSTAIRLVAIKRQKIDLSIAHLFWIPHSSEPITEKELMVIFFAQIIGAFWIASWGVGKLFQNILQQTIYWDLFGLACFYLPFVISIIILRAYKQKQ